MLYPIDVSRLMHKICLNDSYGCWNWTGAVGKNGYGQIQINGRVKSAHRVMFALWKEINLTNSMHVLHRCDNRLCCNPDHLFLGTNQDNVNDKVSKNRQHKTVSLATKQQIVKVYKERKYTQSEIGKQFNVSQQRVQKIVKSKLYNN